MTQKLKFLHFLAYYLLHIHSLSKTLLSDVMNMMRINTKLSELISTKRVTRVHDNDHVITVNDVVAGIETSLHLR